MALCRHVDDARLEYDLAHRVQFLRDFLEFSDQDIERIHAVCPLLVPRLPAIVDAVYAKMLEFDATRRHLTARHLGYAGEVPATTDAVTPDHDLLQFRKRALLSFFTEVLLSHFDATTMDWMDTVGRMHTTRGGNASIHVPLIQMNAMMGFMADSSSGRSPPSTSRRSRSSRSRGR